MCRRSTEGTSPALSARGRPPQYQPASSGSYKQASMDHEAVVEISGYLADTGVLPCRRIRESAMQMVDNFPECWPSLQPSEHHLKEVAARLQWWARWGRKRRRDRRGATPVDSPGTRVRDQGPRDQGPWQSQQVEESLQPGAHDRPEAFRGRKRGWMVQELTSVALTTSLET